MKKFLLVIFIAFILISCDVDNAVSPDVSAPTAFVTFPANWSTIVGVDITLNFDVIDANLDSLEVFLNGQKLETFYNAPVEYDLAFADYDEGLFTTYCKAYDSVGNIGISELINFYWEDENPPQSDISVEIVRPVVWEVFENNQVETSLNISSSQGVQSVEIFVDGESFYSFESTPYQNTLTVDNVGEHNLYAVVTDSLGNSQNSILVNFSIQDLDNESPNGFITYPTDWSNQDGNMQVRISAIDDVEVAEIVLYIDGEIFTQTSSQPYSFNIDTNDLENGKHTLFAIIYDSSENYNYTQLINFEVNN